MSGFSGIPGLGFAKPNEKLPESNFAPESIKDLTQQQSQDGSNHAIRATNSEATNPDTTVVKVEEIATADELSAAGNTSVSQSTEQLPMPIEAQLSEPEVHAHDSMEVDTPAITEPNETGGEEAVVKTEIAEEEVDAGGDSNVLDALAASLEDTAAAILETQQQLQQPNADVAAPEVDGADAMDHAPTTATNDSLQAAENPEGAAEWEADSSPYESSSSDDSDSSDDSSDAQSDSEVLGIQETARLLLENLENGSDDEEDGKKGKNTSTSQVRSKNEQLEPVAPKPDITITEEEPVVLLGTVLHIVDNSAVIKGNTDGQYRVLDEGSILCKRDRTVLGVVADVIGNVQSPMYVVRFQSAEEIVQEGIATGSEICYAEKHSTFVFTQALQGLKGSDASNLHDEEVGADEMEFSDDEKEQAYKKGLKMKRRGGKAHRDGDVGRQPHPLRHEVAPSEYTGELNYDDDEDGPYKPLQRPANFGQGLPPTPPIHSAALRGGGSRGNRGDFRGSRGGRGRGGRGRGHSDGYSRPLQNGYQASPQAVPAPAPAQAQGSAGFPWPFPPPGQVPYGQPIPPPPVPGQFNMQQFASWFQSQSRPQQAAQGQPQGHAQPLFPPQPPQLPPAHNDGSQYGQWPTQGSPAANGAYQNGYATQPQYPGSNLGPNRGPG